MQEDAYRALAQGAETSETGIRWLTALSRTLPWVWPLLDWRSVNRISHAAVAALTAYTHPEGRHRDDVERILASPEITRHLLLNLQGAGHHLETATHADPHRDPGSIGGPVERAWHWARRQPGEPEPVPTAADRLLGASHGAEAGGAPPEPVWPPLPGPLVRADPPWLGPPARVGVQVKDAPDGAAWPWRLLVEAEHAPAEIQHSLVTRRLRSWLWLVRAAAALLPAGGTLTGPGPGGSVRVVARRELGPHSPVGLVHPRWAYITLTPEGPSLEHLWPLWGAALGRWPLQHALAATAFGERDMAEYQHAEPWRNLEPEAHMHVTQAGTVRAQVLVHEELPSD